MAINMGDIEARVTVDTGQATKALTSLKSHVETLESELSRIQNGEVKVGAKVERSMQDAVKLSRDLYDSLTKAGQAADGVNAPKDMTRALSSSRKAAEGLASSLEQAGAATGKISAPRDMSGSLHASAAAAEQLATGLDRAGSEADQLGSKTSSSLPRAESALTGLLGTVKQLAPALSAAAVGGAVLNKGWARLTSIDTAQFKLQGLGHTAESTAVIMDSAMKAVKGTAFGFGDAASIAASSVASGIKPGEQLTGVLTTIADAAAISGRSLGEMGAIFNKIAASGIIQGEELNQLADSGIPVLQLLSQEMGVTAGEVKKLASEGKIGFAEFEAAMRSGMGGAAQEMGNSILGSLQNVGAAVGRLGASLMTPFVGAGTSAVGTLTEAIDTATGAVDYLGKGISAIPGPVKEMASALLLVKAASVALNTEMGQKFQGHLKKVSAGFTAAGVTAKKFGADIAASYAQGAAAARAATAKHREAALAAKTAALATSDGFAAADHIMRQFGHTTAASVSAASTHLRGFATAGANVAATAVKGLGSALGGLVNALGGPLNIAIAGAAILGTKMVEASRAAKQAHETMATSARDAAEAQEALRLAVAGTRGELQGEGLSAASTVAAGSLAELVSKGEAASKTFGSMSLAMSETEGNMTWLRQAFLKDVSREYHDHLAQNRELADQYKALTRTMETMGLTTEDLNSVVAKGGPEYDKLLSSLEASGPAGQKAAEELRGVHSEIDQAVSAGRTLPEAMKQASEGLDVLASSSSDAEQKMKAMEQVMQALGLLPQDLSRAMLDQAQAIQKLSAEASKLEKVPDLFGPDGQLNWDNAKIAPVVDMLDEMRSSLEAVAANGGDATAELEKWEPVFESMRTQLGLTKPEMEALRQEFGLLDGETINTFMNLEGADEATQKLLEVHAGLKNIPVGQSITIDAKSLEMVRPELEAVGADLERLENGDYSVSLNSQDALTQLGELAMHGQAANGEVAKLGRLVGDLPEHKAVQVEALTEDSESKLTSLGVKVEHLDGGGATLQIDDTQVRDAMGVFDALGAKAESLPDGRIDVTGNTPEVLAELERIGLAPKEFEGRLYIDDNTTITRDNLQSVIEKLGSVQGKTVNIDADSSGAQSGANKAQGAIDSVRGKEVSVTADTSGATGPLERVKSLLGGLKDKTINVFTKHHSPAGSSSGFADGGLIPRLASGDMTHGGYQLPMTGPGTGTTDGILGLDAQGLATAWVDRGEYVTNRAATQKYLPWLEAINADDMARLAQLAKGVPGLAGGGSAAGSAHGKTSAGKGKASTTVSVDGGALGELGAVSSELGAIGEGAEAVVTADTSKAQTLLGAVSDAIGDVEGDKAMSVKADTANASKGLLDLDKQVSGLTDTPKQIGVEFDAAGLDQTVTTALTQITELSQQEAMPTVGLDSAPLTEGSVEATGVIEELDAQNPVPVADMDNAPLLGEVAEADGELNRLGGAKSTSVADVDNSSALANINSTITELNKMPVERVIKIVAHGSTEGLAGGGKVPGLATGGQVDGGYKLPTTGPGTGTVDGFMGVDGAGMPLVRVNAGEWVINRNRSEEYDKELELINAGKFPKLDDIDRIPGLFKGGVVSPDQLMSFVRGNTVRGYTPPGPLQNSPYIWGGGLLANWGDCSGAMSGLAALATGGDPNGRKFATMNEGPVLASMGFRPGLGPAATSFNIGWFNGGVAGGHTSGTIGGKNVEMGGGPGGGKVGAAAGASHPQYTNHAWLPLGELVAFDYFRNIAPVSHSRIPAPSGGYSPTGGLGVGPGGLGVGPGGAGVTLHDKGGWLQPGGMAVNMLRKPEPVLNPSQWSTFESAVKALPGATDGMIQAARSLDNVVTQMSKWSDTPVETGKAWNSLAKGELTAESILAARRGQPLVGLGINAKSIIGNDASNQIVSLAGKGGFAAQANGALEQELVVNIAMSEHTIRAAENLEKAREDDAQAAEKVQDAEKKLREAREKSTDQQAANAKAVRNAEEALANARREAGKPVKSRSDKKKATAEDHAKAAAKASETAAKNATKLRDAEEKLAEARKKQADGAQDNADAVKQAEEDLATARENKAKAAARIIEAQTGLQIATILAALEVVDKAATRVGDTVVGAFEGAASAASMLTDAITRMSEVSAMAADAADRQLDAQLAAINQATAAQNAVERLREAERKQREDSQAGYRRLQQAEYDLATTRWKGAQEAGYTEQDLSVIRQQGIFDVFGTSQYADQLSIMSASDVAVAEAGLANARAEVDQANYMNQLAVADAAAELEYQQQGAKFAMDALTNASYQLASAQRFAAGELAGQTGLERHLQGQQMVAQAKAKRSQGIASIVSSINPLNWFRGSLSKGIADLNESKRLEMEGRAKAEAYREIGMQELSGLSTGDQEVVRRAMAYMNGDKSALDTTTDVLTGIATFITGDSNLMAAKSEADMARIMQELNAATYRSKHNMEASELKYQKEADRIERERKRSEIEFTKSSLERQMESWGKRDYMAELVSLTKNQLDSLDQENKQLRTIGDKIDDRNKSVLMSIGGSGWGGALPVEERVGGFGGVLKRDLSLFESARMESGWLNEAMVRAITPMVETVNNLAGAVGGRGGFPTGLPDTVVDGYYKPVEGAEQALRDAARRNSEEFLANTAAVRELTATLREAGLGPSVGTQYTGPVTVNSNKADQLLSSMSSALVRA